MISSRIKTSVWFPAALIASAAILAPTVVQARPTYGPGAGGSIPDGGSSIASSISVGTNFQITAFNSVVINGLNHTWSGDLVATLSHGGVTVDLFDRIGRTTATGFGNSSAISNGNYTFVASGGSTLPASGTINPGTYNTYINGTAGQSSTATGAFSNFVGLSVAGTWTLTVRDLVTGDTGSFTNWYFNADVNTTPPPPPPPGTYTGGPGGNIADASTNLTTGVVTAGFTTSDINVTDNFNIQSFNSITIEGLVHSLAGDLTIQLEHVGTGTIVDLSNRLGQLDGDDQFDYGDDSNFSGDYTFTLGGASLLSAAQQGNTQYDITAGTYAASTNLDSAYANSNLLSSFNGQNINGTWRLRITDSAEGDTGSFTGWRFNTTPAAVTVPEAGTLNLLLPVLGGVAALGIARRRRINNK